MKQKIKNELLALAVMVEVKKFMFMIIGFILAIVLLALA